MLDALARLGLEVKSIDRVAPFYTEILDLDVLERTDRSCRLDAGDPELVLRRPRSVPRGGVHTHYACWVPRAEYDDWVDRFADAFGAEPIEHRFGDARSLYGYDPAGNCVELGEGDVDGPGIDGVFEVVLEVRELSAAEERYRALGFETVDRGSDRRRVRLDGPVALELWEPQLGLADARGGLHVDLGFRGDPDAVLAVARERGWEEERLEGGVCVIDPDGHVLTVTA